MEAKKKTSSTDNISLTMVNRKYTLVVKKSREKLQFNTFRAT